MDNAILWVESVVGVAVAVCVIIAVFVITLLFVLTFAASLWEKLPVPECVKATGGEDIELAPVSQKANDAAEESGYRHLGTYHAVNPNVRGRYDFWISPDDLTLAIIVSGTVIKWLQWNRITLCTMLSDKTVMRTTNKIGSPDLSGQSEIHNWPGVTFTELVEKHDVRLADVETIPFPATDPVRKYFAMERCRIDALISLGYAYYFNDDQTVWRYTLKGAWKHYVVGVWHQKPQSNQQSQE